jgi:hypothetical protein
MGASRIMTDKVFKAGGHSIKKSELVSVFADLVHFGLRWCPNGKSYVFNYIDKRYELFSDEIMKIYLLERRKKLGIIARENRLTVMIGMLRFLAKEMCVSEKWFVDSDAVPVPVYSETVPVMEWERL